MPFAFCPDCASIEYFEGRPDGYVCNACLSWADGLQRTLPEFE